jgi:hypothetical protein
LINSNADVNNLFIVEPSLQSFISIFNALNIAVCDSTCIPSQLFDFFVSTNISSIANTQLTTGLVNAWALASQPIQNSNTGTAKIRSLDPNWNSGPLG